MILGLLEVWLSVVVFKGIVARVLYDFCQFFWGGGIVELFGCVFIIFRLGGLQVFYSSVIFIGQFQALRVLVRRGYFVRLQFVGVCMMLRLGFFFSVVQFSRCLLCSVQYSFGSALRIRFFFVLVVYVFMFKLLVLLRIQQISVSEFKEGSCLLVE